MAMTAWWVATTSEAATVLDAQVSVTSHLVLISFMISLSKTL